MNQHQANMSQIARWQPQCGHVSQLPGLSAPPCWHTEGAPTLSQGKGRPGDVLPFEEPRRAAATPGPALGGKIPRKSVPKMSPLLLAPSQAPPCHLTRRGPWGQAHLAVPATPPFPAQQTPISSPEGITQRQGLAPAQTIRSAASHTREGGGGVLKAEFNPASVCAAPRAWAWRQESQAGRTPGGRGGVIAWLSRSSQSRSGSKPGVSDPSKARALRMGGQGGHMPGL